jgi:hypothetical protein
MVGFVGDLSDSISSTSAHRNRSDAPRDAIEFDDRRGGITWHSSPIQGVLSLQTHESDLNSGDGPAEVAAKVEPGWGHDPGMVADLRFHRSERVLITAPAAP